MSALTITDLFCGAGGSGLGAAAAGFRLVMAANHWDRAIETHALNFPDTEHDLADISQVDPRRYPATDVLWASPECTNHSQAKGVARALAAAPDVNGETLPMDAAERSRATMWDVVRFTESMLLRGKPYRAVIVENVVESAKWIPFRAWLMAMETLGYNYQLVSLNSMHAPAVNSPRAPQSRDRLYVVFYRQGQRKPDVTPRPIALCNVCDEMVNGVQAWKNGRTLGKYRSQYVYLCPQCERTVEPFTLAAAAAIDWTLLGTRIGDRAKPLSPKTMARIQAGLEKFGQRPYLTQFRERIRNIDPTAQPLPTVVSDGANHGLVVPLEGRDGKRTHTTDEPLRTQTARHQDALVVPAGGTWNDTAYPASEPFRTQTTRETQGIAFVAELRGMDGGHNRHLRSTDDPLACVSAGGNHHMLVRHNSSKGPGSEMCTPVVEPMRTLTTHGHQSLVSVTYEINDATFRMLEPSEIQSGMAFFPSYVVTGTRRERVRQLGNGVTPPAAEFLLTGVRESLDVAR